MKILITGGSGFLGSALARHLQGKGHEIALLMRENSSLSRLGTDAANNFNVGRAESDEDITAFVRNTNPQAVVHTACSYGRRGDTALEMLDANVRYGLVVLQAVASHCNPDSVFINTSTALTENAGLYAMSKHHFSRWCQSVVSKSHSRLRFIDVLLQHMYGPGDDASKFSTYVLHACKEGKPSLDLTAGEQERDFIYIDDVAAAYETLLFAPVESGYHAFDVGSGSAPTIRQFVETIHRLTRSSTQLNFGTIPYKPNENMRCIADIARMETLGWHPHFTLEAGILKTLEEDFLE